MLAKLARELPEGDGLFYEPKWDGFRCIVFRDGDDVVLGSRNEKPLTRYFPELVEVTAGQCARSVRARRRDRHRRAVRPRFRRARPSGSIRPSPGSNCFSRTTPASFVAFDLLALGDADLQSEPYADRRQALEGALSDGRAPDPPHTGHRPAGGGPGLVLAVRRSRAGRRRGEGRRSALPARQAGDDEGEARAHRRLRGRRVPVAQVGRGGRVAPPRALRRRRGAPPCRRGLRIQRRPAGGVRRGARALPERVAIGATPGWPRAPPRVGSPGARADGARARTSVGSRCGPSWSPRWPTTTCRWTDSAMPPRSFAGDRTGARTRAPTRSWIPRCPPSSKTSSARRLTPRSADRDGRGALGQRRVSEVPAHRFELLGRPSPLSEPAPSSSDSGPPEAWRGP